MLAELRFPTLSFLTVALTLLVTTAAKADDPSTAAKGEATTAAVATAACDSNQIALRDGDEFWQLSTRGLGGCPTSGEAPVLAVHRYDPASGTWQEQTLADFLAADGTRSTVFYLHGNRVEPAKAVQQGWQVYALVATADSGPLRMIVWSWPSGQIRGPLRDVRSKASRADDESYYFGWVLAHLRPEVHVGILGYSYGARIATGGLHLAAGGSLFGRQLTATSDTSPPAPAARVTVTTDSLLLATAPSTVAPADNASVDPAEPSPSDRTEAARRAGVVLLGPAEHQHWLMADSLHGRALDQVERMLIIYNSCDPALARYRLTDRCEKPQALGYVGIHPESLGPRAERVEQRDGSGLVGKTHNEDAYLRAVDGDELRHYLLAKPESR